MKTIPALQAQTRAHIGLTGQKSIMEGRVTNQYWNTVRSILSDRCGFFGIYFERAHGVQNAP